MREWIGSTSVSLVNRQFGIRVWTLRADSQRLRLLPTILEFPWIFRLYFTGT